MPSFVTNLICDGGMEKNFYTYWKFIIISTPKFFGVGGVIALLILKRKSAKLVFEIFVYQH
jgi:hypothetical protein